MHALWQTCMLTAYTYIIITTPVATETSVVTDHTNENLEIISTMHGIIIGLGFTLHIRL